MLQLWRSDPLVIGAPIAGGGDAERAATEIASRFPANTFFAVVAAHDTAVLAPILTSSLRYLLAEMIFTMPTSGTGLDATSAALLALEQFGIGQDHVFSVGTLDEALPYALSVLQRDQDRWDGDALVVLAAADVLDEARAILDAATG